MRGAVFLPALLQEATDRGMRRVSGVCKFTEILQLPQNTKGGIARC